jgi:hypothetical protein
MGTAGGVLVSARCREASVQAAAKTVTDTEETGPQFETAFAFQQDYPSQDHAEPVGEPDEQHRPVSPVINPEPEKH